MIYLSIVLLNILIAQALSCVDVSTEGYLIDNFCWDLENHVAIDGADLLNNPETHSRHCMFDIPQCIENGYGIITEQPDGTFGYTYKFTPEDNERVLTYLRDTTKEANFLVTVDGIYCEAEDTFSLKSLSDSNGIGIADSTAPAPPADCEPVTTEGYLIDNFCWDMENHIAIDGADLLNAPEAHTRHCMFDIPQCIENGYGIIVQQDDGTYSYKYAFGEADNVRVLEYLEQTPKKSDFLVTVEGSYCETQNLFTLATLSDSNGVAIGAPLEPVTDGGAPPPPPPCSPAEVEGYLIDNFCWELEDHIAIDGADLLNAPENHTRHCMFDIPQCIENGYGIIVQGDNGTYTYSIKFSDEDNERVLAYLESTPKSDDFLVTVKGMHCHKDDTFQLDVLLDSNGIGIESKKAIEEEPAPAEGGTSSGYHKNMILAAFAFPASLLVWLI